MKVLSQKYVSLIIVTVMIVTVMANPMTYLKFKLNQEYIAKVLCVNKSKPQLKCNGHCYLAKQLKKAQQEEESAKKMLEEMGAFELFCDALSVDLPLSSYFIVVIDYNRMIHFSVQDHFFELIQPPRV
jgi:hypothetical protein